MTDQIDRVVVIGGGTAGWLTASLLAARWKGAISVTLIESPDVKTIGVGEGSWPTLRNSLNRIGLKETDFLTACQASFKQGSRFEGWVTGEAGDICRHPFTPPVPPGLEAVIESRHFTSAHPFANQVTPQAAICEAMLTPRQARMPDYAGALNYGYHFDAGRLAELLQEHATTRLGVIHHKAHVTEIMSADNGDIAAVRTRDLGDIEGDLFVDCTGHASRLLGQHYGIEFEDCGHILFNDRALALQIPYDDAEAPIASETIATAHQAGWIWDIGLYGRRGVGCVYSSAHMSDDAAANVLAVYVSQTQPKAPKMEPRQLSFRSGHRKTLWHRNCVGIGLSAGFLEPLEATAIVLIELSAQALADQFPQTRSAMDVRARQFNGLFSYHWQRIIDFLKLHYVLSKRDEPYWRAHRDLASIPESLSELLDVWKTQIPGVHDFSHQNEFFPPASYQYILYGMGFETHPVFSPVSVSDPARTGSMIEDKARGLASALQTNRAYLQQLHAAGASQSILTGAS